MYLSANYSYVPQLQLLKLFLSINSIANIVDLEYILFAGFCEGSMALKVLLAITIYKLYNAYTWMSDT